MAGAFLSDEIGLSHGFSFEPGTEPELAARGLLRPGLREGATRCQARGRTRPCRLPCCSQSLRAEARHVASGGEKFLSACAAMIPFEESRVAHVRMSRSVEGVGAAFHASETAPILPRPVL